MVHWQIKPNFYRFYGRGGRSESGTERTESISLKKAARTASNKLNLERGPMRGKAILPYKVNYINSSPPGRPESPNK